MTISVQHFGALASEARLKILEALREKRLRCEDPGACDLSERCCSVGELADRLGLTQPTVSHHLKELRRAGLVRLHGEGRTHYCSLDEATFEQLSDWLDQFGPTGGDGTCS